MTTATNGQAEAAAPPAQHTATKTRNEADREKQDALLRLLRDPETASLPVNTLAKMAGCWWTMAKKTRAKFRAGEFGDLPLDTSNMKQEATKPEIVTDDLQDADDRGSSIAEADEAATVSDGPFATRDGLGTKVPAHLRPAFFASGLKLEAMRLNRIASLVRSAAAWIPFFSNARQAAENLEAISVQMENALPFAVHPACKGNGCTHCKGAGWLPYRQYKELLAEGLWDRAAVTKRREAEAA